METQLLPSKKGHSPQFYCRSMSVVAKRSPISATAELLFCSVPCGRLSWLLVSFWAHVNIVHRVVLRRRRQMNSDRVEQRSRHEGKNFVPDVARLASVIIGGTWAEHGNFKPPVCGRGHSHVMISSQYQRVTDGRTHRQNCYNRAGL